MRRALAIALAALCATQAVAHDWYPATCCSGRDCAPVAPDAIRCTPEGCTVTIVPGTHPMVPADMNGGKAITLKATKPPEFSPDGMPHACIGYGPRVLCLFVGGGT